MWDEIAVKICTKSRLRLLAFNKFAVVFLNTLLVYRVLETVAFAGDGEASGADELDGVAAADATKGVEPRHNVGRANDVYHRFTEVLWDVGPGRDCHDGDPSAQLLVKGFERIESVGAASAMAVPEVVPIRMFLKMIIPFGLNCARGFC